MKTYLLRDIPPALWARVGRRAKRDGLKLRSLLMALLEAYDEGRLTVRESKVVAGTAVQSRPK